MSELQTGAKPLRLKVNELFLSLQGESSTVGLPTVFVRLTGCPLRCRYCDTEYAFSGGKWYELEPLIEAIGGFGVKHVCVTGGEPLAQANSLSLLRRLCDLGLQVSLETSGAFDISAVDERVSRVMDLKSPDSGELARNRWQNIEALTVRDQVKFVLCSEADYRWACQQLEEHRLTERCGVLFSPCAGQLSATDLADWIVRDRLPVRFQIQLHKYLWGDKQGV